MENWLDFNYRQMPEVQNPMWNQMQPCQQMMPYPAMQGSMPSQTMTAANNPLEYPPSPIPPSAETQGPVQNNKNYLQGYLKTQIGRSMRVQFLIGTGILTDRVGTLLSVGIDYIVLNPTDSSDIEICDLYSIKFVAVYGGKNEFLTKPMPRKEE